MARLLRWLADPTHVAEFQELCGVRLIADVPGDDASVTRNEQQSPHPSASSCVARQRMDTPAAPGSAGHQALQHSIAANGDAATPRWRQQHQLTPYSDADSNGAAFAGNGHADRSLPWTASARRKMAATAAASANELSGRGGSDGVVRPCLDDDDDAAVGAAGENQKAVCVASSSATLAAADRLQHPSPVPSTQHLGRTKKEATRIQVRYPPLKWLAKMGATLGNEEFYLTAFPFMLWAFDAVVTRQISTMFCLVMYLGQATKDYLRWPRPPSPPVIRLETQHLQEFSMPSTHAMAGTGIPLLLAKLVLERYELPVILVVAVVALWWGSTCFSRLYLGVHTILDVVCGVLYALIIFISFAPLMARYDHYQQTHPFAPLVLMATSLALCTICYPSKDKNSAQGDAVQITSVLVGVGIGAWLNYQLGFSKEVHFAVPLPAHLPTLQWLRVSILQFVAGVAVLLTLKSVVKHLTVCFFSSLFGLDRVNSHHPNVLVAYKYTTYLILGLAIAFFIPLLFTVLGIDRPHYYSEVI